jgi:hypothetical protein
MRAALLIVLGGCATAHAAPPRSPPPIDDPYFTTADDPAPDGWAERWREPLVAGGAAVTLVGQEEPGEGQAIVVLRDGHALGAYRFDFGGLGGELAIVRRCRARDRATLELRATGTTRGYWLSPGQGTCPLQPPPPTGTDGDDQRELDTCYIGPSTEVTYVELAIDARHVWLAGEGPRPAPHPCDPAPRP